MLTLRRLRGLLRSRRLIVTEALVLAGLGVLGAVVPQAAQTPAAQLARLTEDHPVLMSWTGALGLDHVFGSPPFLAAVAVATASLVTVTYDQWRHFLRVWKAPLIAAVFVKAPFRATFERAANPEPRSGPRQELRSSGRMGGLGSPLLHVGLLMVIAAGLARALFGADAMVDLVEGESLAPEPSAWVAQWPGPFARPFSLDETLRLDALVAERYPSGKLRRLVARLERPDRPVAATVEIAVNTPLRSGSHSIYLSSLHGPAVFVEVDLNGVQRRTALLLDRSRDGSIEGSAEIAPGLEMRVRAVVPRDETAPPTTLELRLLESGTLAYSGPIAVGETLEWAGDRRLTVHGARQWARFSGSRDHATWLAYTGFALIVIGAVLIFAVVRVDTAVIVTPAGDREQVLVALRAARFAPLFAERFDDLVRREGGTPGAER